MEFFNRTRVRDRYLRMGNDLHEQGFQRITLRMQLLQLLQCTEEHDASPVDDGNLIA